jgi:anthranilate phosphoribosyltransferase
MIKEILKSLISKKDLSSLEMKSAMNEITSGKVSDIELAAFLTALNMKGMTVEEITSAAQVMKEKCLKINLDTTETLDIVGTGGDMANTFNISTTTAFIAAAGGVPVAKHGNRASTSKSGSIDVLEGLGISTDKTFEQEISLFKKLNLCFMFATKHHPAMKYASKVRKELPFRTLFNILGPLTNPAGATSQLFGVYDEKLVIPLCKVIANLGVKNVLVIHGNDGLDEATICEETMIAEYKNGKMREYSINPKQFGLNIYNKKDIEGGTPEYNAQIIRDIFSKKEQGGKREIILLNSALAFYTYGKVQTIQDGVDLAKKIIDNGFAEQKLLQYIELSKEER